MQMQPRQISALGQLIISSGFFVIIVDVFEDLHKCDILHRDVKLENILAVPAGQGVIIVAFVHLLLLRALSSNCQFVNPGIQTAVN